MALVLIICRLFFLLDKITDIYDCFFFFNLFIYGCAGSLLLCRFFSSCGKWGLLSGCRAWASHCGGFSLQSVGSRAQTQELWHVGQ